MEENEELLTLLERIAKRDESAMRSLHLKLSRRVFAFITYRLRDRASAEEALSDTMLAVWQQAGTFERRSKVLTWILSIAENKVRMAVRRLARPGAEPIEPPDVDIPDGPEPGGPDPLELLQQKRAREHLRHCMDALSGKLRASLHLYYFQGLSLAEIAKVVQANELNVKTRLSNGRRKIGDCLRNLFGPLSPAGDAT